MLNVFRCVALALVQLVFLTGNCVSSSAQVISEKVGQFAKEQNSATAQSEGKLLKDSSVRFRGWKYGAKHPAYLNHFNRTRKGSVPKTEVQINKNELAKSTNNVVGLAPSTSLPWIQTRPSLPAGYIPVSVTTADFNGDGKMDWVVCNGGDNNLWIYLGNGDGSWRMPTILPVNGLAPLWVVAGDFRGNGKQDLVVAEADSGSVGVFLGNGDGTFAPEQQYFLTDAPLSLAVGDFNGDGKLDILAGLAPAGGQNALAVLPGTGSGSFGTAIISKTAPTVLITPAVSWISLGDLNNDGILDAVVELDGAIFSFIGNGRGGFKQNQLIADPFVISYSAAAVGDMNEDGCADVVVLDTLAHAITYTGDCHGDVTQQNQYSIGDFGISVALRDIDGDGHLDIVSGGFLATGEGIYGGLGGNLLTVLRGDGHANFAEGAVYRGDDSLVSIAFADINGDGQLDVVSANQDSDTVTVFLNDGQGGFGPPSGYALGYGIGVVNAPTSGLLLTDLNGDGKKDLALMELPMETDNADQNLQLVTLLSQGNGKFAPKARYPVASGNYYLQGDFAFGDFRNTGHPDFVAIGGLYSDKSAPNFLSFLPNNGDGTFGSPIVTNPSTAQGIMAIGDFNRDGKLDFIAIGPGNTSSLNMFLGKGDGTFTALPGVSFDPGAPTDVIPRSVYAVDLNRDGKLDILVYLIGNVVPFTANAAYEFLGNGDGTFQPPVQLFNNIDPLTMADVNGDGIPDLITCRDPLANYPSFDQVPIITIYLGRGDASFAQTYIYQPYSSDIDLFTYGTGNAGGGFCTLADFNGDGKLDIALWQRPTGTFGNNYLQFLVGNGDGSFTPTYDLFRVHKGTVPQYALDVNGDGLVDLVELDGSTTSYNYTPSSPAPPFQIGLLAEPVVSLGQLQITLNVPSSSATTFSLTASEADIQIPATATIPAGEISTTLSFGFAKSFNPNHVFSVTANSNSHSETTYGWLWNGVFSTGLKVGLTIPFQSAVPGGSTQNYGVGIGTVGDYTTTATLSCEGLPLHAQCVFDPDSYYLAPNEPETGEGAGGAFLVSTDPSIAPGKYSFNVVAGDGAVTASTPATLTVLIPEPDLIASSASYSGYPGVGTPFTATVSIVNNGNVASTSTSLTYSVSGSAVVTSATATQGTCSLSSASCALDALRVGGGVEINFALQPSAAGTVTLTAVVTPTPTDLNPANNTTTFSETVADFTFSIVPASLTVSAGQAAQYQATITPVGGAFNNPVALACTGATSGIQCTVLSGFIPDQSPVTTTVTVTTKAPGTAQSKHVPLWQRSATLLAMCFGLTVIGFKKRRNVSSFVLIVACCFALNSCGGGSSSSSGGGAGSGSPGTPAGTYNLMLTASSGTNQKSMPITLVVQ